ncbi:MAG: Gfo/Idh/MocA family oxidoreductase, partial [Sulfitobacter sp.]
MALNWAIIGTGFISHQAIDGIVKSDGSQLHSIYGRNSDMVMQLQSQYGFPKLSFDLDELLSDPDVDAVYLGLPNHLHKDAAIKAAKAGKAVLSEKSLTTTMGDADALLAAVAQTRTFFVEGLMYLSHPFLSRFVEVLQDGRLGDLR